MSWRLRLHYSSEFQIDTGQSPEDISSQVEAEPGNQENDGPGNSEAASLARHVLVGWASCLSLEAHSTGITGWERVSYRFAFKEVI